MFVPAELTQRPFALHEARVHGLTEDKLRGASWRRLYRGVYAWHAIADDRLVRLRAMLYRLPEGAVFSGLTAAWLYGLDVNGFDPIEVTLTTPCKVTRRAGLRVRRGERFETSIARGLPVTSRIQTVTDIARIPPLFDAVAFLDIALHRRLVTSHSLQCWADANPQRRGVALFRQALELAEPATESPMETRLRLLLVMAGLPRPTVQLTLRDPAGAFIARPDLCYPVHRLAIEYDGATHKDSIASDNRRQNRLFDAGYRILRFTAADVLGNPANVASLVRSAIARPLVDPSQRAAVHAQRLPGDVSRLART